MVVELNIIMIYIYICILPYHYTEYWKWEIILNIWFPMKPWKRPCWFHGIIFSRHFFGHTLYQDTNYGRFFGGIEHIWKYDDWGYFSGWWFGTFFIFPYIGNVIIPIGVHIFQRGGPTTNQFFRDGWIIILSKNSLNSFFGMVGGGLPGAVFRAGPVPSVMLPKAWRLGHHSIPCLGLPRPL